MLELYTHDNPHIEVETREASKMHALESDKAKTLSDI